MPMPSQTRAGSPSRLPAKADRQWSSLAKLPPQAPGFSREEAIRLLAELQEMDQRLLDLREWLVRLVVLASDGLQP